MPAKETLEAFLINGRDSSEANSVRGEEESPLAIVYINIYGTNAPSGPDHTGNASCTNPFSNTKNDNLSKVCRDSMKKSRQSQIMDLFLSPHMQTALLADLVQSFIIVGLESSLPVRIEAVFDYNVKQIALLFLVMSFPFVISPIIGHLGNRLGSKKMVTIAMRVFFLCTRNRQSMDPPPSHPFWVLAHLL